MQPTRPQPAAAYQGPVKAHLPALRQPALHHRGPSGLEAQQHCSRAAAVLSTVQTQRHPRQQGPEQLQLQGRPLWLLPPPVRPQPLLHRGGLPGGVARQHNSSAAAAAHTTVQTQHCRWQQGAQQPQGCLLQPLQLVVLSTPPVRALPLLLQWQGTWLCCHGGLAGGVQHQDSSRVAPTQDRM